MSCLHHLRYIVSYFYYDSMMRYEIRSINVNSIVLSHYRYRIRHHCGFHWIMDLAFICWVTAKRPLNNPIHCTDRLKKSSKGFQLSRSRWMHVVYKFQSILCWWIFEHKSIVVKYLMRIIRILLKHKKEWYNICAIHYPSCNGIFARLVTVMDDIFHHRGIVFWSKKTN